MMMATARKTSVENEHLPSCDMICNYSILFAKFATTGPVCRPLN